MANGKGDEQEQGTAFEAAADGFERFARDIANATGRPWAFLLALATVILWAATGPYFHFSDTWQLVINTGTTIVTFLMVFLIQRSQNRDTMALQAKLAELVIAVKGAKNEVAMAEDLSEHALKQLHERHSEEAQLKLDRIEREAANARVGKVRTPEGTK